MGLQSKSYFFILKTPHTQGIILPISKFSHFWNVMYCPDMLGALPPPMRMNERKVSILLSTEDLFRIAFSSVLKFTWFLLSFSFHKIEYDFHATFSPFQII